MRVLAEAYYGEIYGSKLAGYNFFCPACDKLHHYRLNRLPGDDEQPIWSFDGNMERPTFTPSLLLYRIKTGVDERKTLCHLFVTAGEIDYCGDCPHEYAGRRVPMVDLDSPGIRERFQFDRRR